MSELLKGITNKNQHREIDSGPLSVERFGNAAEVRTGSR